MNAAWYEKAKAKAKAKELGDQSGKSWSMTIGENQMENAANIRVGLKINFRTISISSPYFDMDIDLPEGTHFVSFDDVADTEMLHGDANYLVEMSTEQVIAFYKDYQKRFLTTLEQSEMASDEENLMITDMTFLQHEGDVEVGDDVVKLIILPAPKRLLSDALGRNQGTWTLICVNRWVEEDY